MKLEDTIKGFKMILSVSLMYLPEAAFLFWSARVEDVRAQGRKLER